jgi:phosphoglycolate phosphatase
MVGDSSLDVEAAHAAGMAVAAVTWGFTPRESLIAVRPDFLAGSVQELESWLLGPDR